MSARALVLLIVLLAGVCAALVWLGRGEKAPEPVPATAPLVPPFTEADLREIAVSCSGAGFGLDRDAAGAWRIASPEPGEADPRPVRELVASLQDARVKKVIADAGASAEAFGLQPAACTVRLDTGAKAPPFTLRLGRSSPVGAERYAAGNDARVLLTDGSLYASLTRGVEAYREKRLIPVDPETISRIALERPDGELVLARAGETWRLESPRAESASPLACGDLARAVAHLEFVASAGAPVPRDARSERRLRLAVSTRDGGPPRVAFIAAAGIEGKRLAWREGAPRAGLVDESAASTLFRPVADFRAPPPSPASGS